MIPWATELPSLNSLLACELQLEAAVALCTLLTQTAHLSRRNAAQYDPIASIARIAGLETMCGQMREHSLQQNPTDCLDPSEHRGTSVLPGFQKEHVSRYSF